MTEHMNSITEMMTGDHRACDARYVELEQCAEAGDWERADAAFVAFRDASLRHLRMEEEVLFPAFEAATGSDDGPTAVMRMEHEQMRGVLDQIGRAVAGRDSDRLLGLAESLMVLVQQHNMKEESILYPMSDQSIPGASELLERMQAIEV